MNIPHSQGNLASGTTVFSSRKESPEDLCFGLSRLIAKAIKMFFSNMVQKGRRSGQLQGAVACSQLVLPAVFESLSESVFELSKIWRGEQLSRRTGGIFLPWEKEN